jgi:hypothetical protein
MTTGRFSRAKLYLALAIVFCVFVPAATVTVTVYYAQTQGMCLRTGRVLSADELRKAVLVNALDNEIERTYAYNREQGSDDSWVGINSPAQETNLKKIIDFSFNNGKSFEENFGLKTLVKGREKEDYALRDMLEPFLLVIYSTYSSSTFLYVSSDVQEIPFTELDAIAQVDVPLKITAYRRLLGYGNHYFNIPFRSFNRECCDNKNQSDNDYMKEKQYAYDSAVNLFESLAPPDGYLRKDAAIVSNCGDILRTKQGDISWLGTPPEYEDLEWP